MSKKITIGSRGSDLALWQANFVQSELKRLCNIEAEIQIIKTKGDRIQDLSFDKLEGKGFFTKEIEQALLDKEVDLAVHSFKDLETTWPKGLCIAAVSEREDPADLLLIKKSAVDPSLPFGLKKGAVVGTSSARRQSQLLFFRPDTHIKDIRGNVPTRIEKLSTIDFDAIVLAKAGVDRLEFDLSEFHVHAFDVHHFIPAAAQGVLALQTRVEDVLLIKDLQKLNSADVSETVGLERSILKGFGAGCQVPLGIHCDKVNDKLRVWVSKAEEKTALPVQAYFEGISSEALKEKVLDKYSKPAHEKILFFKELRKDQGYVKMLEAFGFKVEGKSLISIDYIEKEIDTAGFDWIFLSSKNAVDALLMNIERENLANLKVGAIAQDTGAYAKKEGLNVQFVGKEENTEDSAMRFASLLNEKERVLFPISNISHQTVQKYLAKEQYENEVVYVNSTVFGEVEVKDTDILVFTSSSHVNAFFTSGNVIPERCKVFSIGEKTTISLKEYEVDAVTSYAPNMMALARTIIGV